MKVNAQNVSCIKYNNDSKLQTKASYVKDSDLSFKATEKKVSLKEGSLLFFNGVKAKFLDTGREIKDHPIRTVVLSVATVGALSFIPSFFGITVGVGSVLVATAFGGMAAFRIVKDVVKIGKSSKQHDYNEERKLIGDLGGDSFDAAMTTPFFPKGIREVKGLKNLSKAMKDLSKYPDLAKFLEKNTIIKPFRINKNLLNGKEADSIFKKIISLYGHNVKVLKTMTDNKLIKKGIVMNTMERMITVNNITKTVFNTLNSSLFGTVMGVFSSSSLISRRVKELGLDDKTVKDIEQMAMNMTKNIVENSSGTVAKSNSN